MPEYKVPEERDYSFEGETPKKNEKMRAHRITLPFDPKQLKKVKVGDKIHLTLKGEVVGTHLDEGKRSRSDIEFGLDTVGYYKNSQVEEVLGDENEED